MEAGKINLRHRKLQRTIKIIGPQKFISSGPTRTKDGLPTFAGFGIIFVFLCLLQFFYIRENSLPPQVSLKDAASQPGRFVGERAELQLKTLTSLGTRVVGSYENEVLAVDFLQREISFIAREADSSKRVEVDIQKPSGSYYLSFKPFGFGNYYANIQNVVAKLYAQNNSTNSVLLNCHYDTVPESPGASDNGINCVIMLEILKVLSSDKKELRNNIIFLFNGAEENPLQASHGFLSQHKWRHEVKVVINLDSAGAGGKEILFQTSGDAWLAQAFAMSVPRPTAGVHAEELFQFGIIPSDTDFRVFRDFGKYPGFDIAHCANGYIYHTKYDTMAFIHPGVYQRTGDNILALVRELGNSSEIDKTHSKGRIVYFDVFELFVVVYTESLAFILHVSTALISFWSIFKTYKASPDAHYSFVKYLSVSTGGQLLGLLCAGVVTDNLIKILDLLNSTMSWYLRPWLIIPLYVFPLVVSMTSMLFLVNMVTKRDLDGYRVIGFINGAQLLWTLVLLLGTLLGIRTSFILMLTVLSPSIGSLFVSLSKRGFKVKTYLYVYISCLTLAILFMLNQCVRIFITLIPMTGRMGPHTNPEIIIGGLTYVASSVILSFITPIFLLLKKPKMFLILLGAIHVLVMAIVTGTSFGFPYSDNPRSPVLQRFYILHCERTFYDVKGSVKKTDSGFFVQSLDRNNINYVSQIIPELKSARATVEECSNELFCGFPIFTSRFIQPAPFSYWIPASPPTIHHPTSLEVVSQVQISVQVRKVSLLITGPDHITAVISPHENVRMLRWSLDEFEPKESKPWSGRSTHMIYYSHGLMGGSLKFDVDLEIPQNQTTFLMDVMVVGHYMHDKKYRTEEFNKFLSRFPNWTHLTPWTTTVKSWRI